MVRLTEMDMTVNKGEVYSTHRALETGGATHHARLYEEAPGSVGRQR